MTELKEICKVQCGFAFDSKKFTEDDSFSPLIRIRDVKRGFTQTYYTGEFSSEYIVHKGDLLVGMDGEFNIARWNSEDALLNQRVCRIIANSNVNEEYLRFYLKRALKLIESKTSFVTVKHLSAKELNGLKLNLPCMEDQQCISKQLSILELVIRKNKKVLELFDELVKARFVEMFGDPRINEKKWKAGKIVDYFEVKGGKRIPKGMGYAERKTNHPYLRASDMKNATILDDDIHYIDEEVYKRIKRYTVNAHDIYLTNVGVNLGMAGVIPKQYDGANLTENAVKLVPKDKILLNGMFLSYYINSPGIQHYINERKMSVGVPKLAIFRIESMPLLLPPLELQNQFASFVEEVDKSRSRIQKSLEASQELFDSLMQEYFG